MKKGFLKTLAAAAVAVTAMALSSVAAFAGEYLWVYEDESSFPTQLNADLSSYSTSVTGSDSKSAAFTDKIFSSGTENAIAGHKGLDVNGQTSAVDTNIDKGFIVTPSEDVTLQLYLARTSSSSVAGMRLYTLTDNGDGTYTRPSDYSSYDAPGNATTGIGYWEISLSKDVPYEIYANNSGVGLFAVNMITSGEIAVSTKYDESSFGTATTATTVTVPGTTVKHSATVAEWADAVGIDTTAAEEGTVNATTAAEIDGFSIVSSSSRAFRYNYTNGTIQTNGSTNANGRYIEFTAEEGDCIKLVDFSSQNSDATDRYAFISSTVKGAAGSSDPIAKAPASAADVTMVVPSAGTYYVCFKDGVQFTSIQIVEGETVAAPTITVSNGVLNNTNEKVEFTCTISDSGDDSVTIESIDFVAAEGYTTTKVPAASPTTTIDTVYAGADGYQFVVGIDAADVTLGAEAQASITTDAGTLYSNVAAYTPAE